MIPEIELYPSGEFFNPLAPVSRKIHIEDIAHNLSMKCRFTGACRYFISVAEHSVAVSRLVPDRLALAGLLHDASEAYLPDIASPVKQSEVYAGHKLAERHLQRVIEEKYRIFLTSKEKAEIKLADNVCVGIEAFFGLTYFSTSEHWAWVRKIHDENHELVEKGESLYRFMGHDSAEAAFLNRWKELTQ